MTRTTLSLLLLLALPTGALAKKPAPAPTLDPDDPTTLQVKKDIKVVFHATADAWKKGLPKPLFYLDRLVQVYPERFGVPASDLDFKLVVHDAPAHWFLTDEGWKASKLKGQKVAQDHNPHKDVVARVIAAGVDIEVCEVTMKQNGITPEMLLPGVKIATAGLPRVIDLQLMGYERIYLD